MDLKAVLSNRIYLSDSTGLREALEAGLRHEIKPLYCPPGKTVQPIIILDMLKIGSCYSIPIGRTDLIPKEYTIIDKRICDEVAHPAVVADVTLRPAQQEIVERITTNCIVHSPTSFGKTFTALHAIREIGLKTLVIVHTKALRDQWVKEYNFLFGTGCGIVGSGKDTSDKYPVSIGNIQTIRNKENIWLNQFGMLVADECHRTPSRTFSQTINKAKAKYKIGLSATIERKDGLHVLLDDYIGGNVLTVDDSANYLIPKILVIDSGVELPTGQVWADRVTKLLEDPDYVQLLYDIIMIHTGKGRKVLALASRTDILYMLEEELESSMLVVGATKDREEKLKTVEDFNPLLGSMQIFSEGISLTHLDTLLICTPLNNRYLLEQVIGRVVRKCSDKKQPLIIDIRLKGNTGRNQALERMAYYTDKGYEVTHVR